MSYKLFHVPNSTDTEYSLVFISILKGLKTDDLRAKHMQQSVPCQSVYDGPGSMNLVVPIKFTLLERKIWFYSQGFCSG